MEPRENHHLLRDDAVSAPAIVHFLLLLFEEQEVAENVHEAGKLEHVLPKVTRAISGRVLRVARTADDLARMTAAVERQEVRRVSRQPGGHVDLVRVGGEMHERPSLELEQWNARVAVFLELADGMTPVLARAGILQLNGGDRQTVHGQNDVRR